MPPKEQIQASIHAYLTPVLICLVGYLLNSKITEVDRRIQRIEETRDTIIELRQRVEDMNRRITHLEDHKTSLLFKHEEEYRLTTHTSKYA